jgi:hypothetical protein
LEALHCDSSMTVFPKLPPEAAAAASSC